jgi:hypothetical protein
MPNGEPTDRTAVLEMLVEMLVRKLPDDEQDDLMERLIERTSGAQGWDEAAHDLDDKVRRDRSARNRLRRLPSNL